MTKTEKPILISVAPNGARKTKADHPNIPLCTEDLVKTAVSCAEAGAGMMHFHIRDGACRHSLNPGHYRKTLTELEAAVGDQLLLQVTSEAAGRYSQPQQIDYMKQLAPHCLSCGLREFIRSKKDVDSASLFFNHLHQAGTLVQYILYSPAEVKWFVNLCNQGILPGNAHFLLFVFGSYTGSTNTEVPSLDHYLLPLDNHPHRVSWMVCGFGQQEFQTAEAAAARGGHVRVGFENNILRPDGRLTEDNSEQVRFMMSLALKHGRNPRKKAYAETLHV